MTDTATYMAADVRTAIVAHARALLGVPFRHHGRDRHGVDCAGLVLRAMNDALGRGDEFMDYPQRPSPDVVRAAIARHADRITAADAGPGDVVLMDGGLRAVHVGVLTDRGVIHANGVTGRVVEHRLGGLAARVRPVAYYRWNGVPSWRQ